MGVRIEPNGVCFVILYRINHRGTQPTLTVELSTVVSPLNPNKRRVRVAQRSQRETYFPEAIKSYILLPTPLLQRHNFTPS